MQIWGSMSAGPDQVLALDCGQGPFILPPSWGTVLHLFHANQIIASSHETRMCKSLVLKLTTHFDRKPFVTHKILTFSLALT